MQKRDHKGGADYDTNRTKNLADRNVGIFFTQRCTNQETSGENDRIVLDYGNTGVDWKNGRRWRNGRGLPFAGHTFWANQSDQSGRLGNGGCMDCAGNGIVSVLGGNDRLFGVEHVFGNDMGRKIVFKETGWKADASIASFFAGRLYRGNVFLEYIKKKKSRYLDGSFTVELACLMPVILLVIFGVWSASFYVHHKVWLTAAAYEAAITGTAESVFQKDQGVVVARLRGEELQKSYFENSSLEKCQISEENDRIQVIYSGDIQALYGGMKWKLQAKGTSVICRPVNFIRKIRMVKNTVTEFGRS